MVHVSIWYIFFQTAWPVISYTAYTPALLAENCTPIKSNQRLVSKKHLTIYAFNFAFFSICSIICFLSDVGLTQQKKLLCSRLFNQLFIYFNVMGLCCVLTVTVDGKLLWLVRAIPPALTTPRGAQVLHPHADSSLKQINTF